jgi:hypothetical protein
MGRYPMSHAEIDSITWHRLFLTAFHGYLSRGVDPSDARRAAAREMNLAFIRSDKADQRRYQRDRDEEREGDWTR